MSLGCARCGSCCDPVKLDFGVWTRAVETARRYQPENIDLDDPGWRRYWADCVFLASRCRPVGARGGGVLLECADYDREHRACRAYENRPPVCSGFPWYDDDSLDALGELGCSYLLDVPPIERPEGARPLIPLSVLPRASRAA